MVGFQIASQYDIESSETSLLQNQFQFEVTICLIIVSVPQKIFHFIVPPCKFLNLLAYCLLLHIFLLFLFEALFEHVLVFAAPVFFTGERLLSISVFAAFQLVVEF